MPKKQRIATYYVRTDGSFYFQRPIRRPTKGKLPASAPKKEQKRDAKHGDVVRLISLATGAQFGVPGLKALIDELAKISDHSEDE